MKKLLTLILAGFVLTAAPALADHHEKGSGHDKGSGYDEATMKAKHEEYKKEKMQKLSDELSLTDDQKPQIQQILDEKWEKKHEIMKATHEQMESLYEETHSKIKAVLTDEQQEKFDAMKKEDKGSMKGSLKGSDHDQDKDEQGSPKGSQ